MRTRRYELSETVAMNSQSTFSFLSLPREVRDMIYRYSCNYNDAIVLFERQVDDVRNGRASFDSNAKSILTTPTILLLNQQITREAMEVLHKTPLVLDMKSPAVDWTNCRPKISIFKFIGLWTLINISLVQIRHPILIGHGCSYLKDLFLECPPMPQRERSAPRHLQFIIEDDGDDEDWTGGTGMAMRDISNRIIEEACKLRRFSCVTIIPPRVKCKYGHGVSWMCES